MAKSPDTLRNSAISDGAKERPDVFSYHHYRIFLRDYFDYLRENKRGFSINRLCNQIEIAPGFITMVLSGSRKFSEGLWDRFVTEIHLSQTEASFLSILRKLDDSESPEVALACLKKAQKFKKYRKQNGNEMDAYQYLTHWHYVVIREMAVLDSFQLDPSWIQQRLRKKIPLPKIRQAIEFLKEKNLIREIDGRIRPSDENIHCNGGIYRLTLAQFHREMFQITADAFSEVERENRMILGRTVAIPRKVLPEISKLLEETRNKIKELEKKYADETVDSVYHISLGAVPLTKGDKE